MISGVSTSSRLVAPGCRDPRPLRARRSTPWSAILLLTLVAACGGGDRRILGLPAFPAEIRAVVFAIERAEGIELRAASLEGTFSLNLQLAAGETVRLTALGYRERLGELGLSEGVLDDVEADACGSRALPRAAEQQAVTITASDAAPRWAPLAAPSEAVARLRIAGRCECRQFRQLATHRITASELLARTTLRDGRVLLLAPGDGAAWKGILVDGEGLTEVALPARAGRVPEVRQMVVGPSDELHLATSNGLWTGSLAEGFGPRAASPDGAPLVALGASSGDGPFELHALTASGTMALLGPDGLTVEHVFPQQPQRSAQRDLLLWQEPGQLAVALRDGLSIFSLRAGRLLRAHDLPPETRGARGLALLPDGTAVAVTSGGRAFGLRGAGVVELGGAPELAEAEDVVRLGDAAVYTGSGGYLKEVRPGLDCPPQLVPDRRPLKWLAVVERPADPLLVAVGPGDGEQPGGRVLVFSAASP
jgi:hypothetical protein